jgi:hypothetical protein
MTYPTLLNVLEDNEFASLLDGSILPLGLPTRRQLTDFD